MEQDHPVERIEQEAAWRSALTPDQVRQLQAWLAAHPEERRAWEEEVALTRLLTRLPDAAAPTNLTARVLAEVDRDASRSPQPTEKAWLGWLRRLGWVPRLAGVAVLVVAGLFGHHQYQISKRNQMARRVAEVTELATVVPPVEVLQDFTAIRNLEHTAVPDEQLLALLE
jgi:anti-sigma factor RsiW